MKQIWLVVILVFVFVNITLLILRTVKLEVDVRALKKAVIELSK